MVNILIISLLFIISFVSEINAYDKGAYIDEGANLFEMIKFSKMYPECTDLNGVMKNTSTLSVLFNQQTDKLKITKIILWVQQKCAQNTYNSYITGVEVVYDTKLLRRGINISFSNPIEVENLKVDGILDYDFKTIPRKNKQLNKYFDEIIYKIQFNQISDYRTYEYKYQQMRKVPLVK